MLQPLPLGHDSVSVADVFPSCAVLELNLTHWLFHLSHEVANQLITRHKKVTAIRYAYIHMYNVHACTVHVHGLPTVYAYMYTVKCSMTGSIRYTYMYIANYMYMYMYL